MPDSVVDAGAAADTSAVSTTVTETPAAPVVVETPAAPTSMEDSLRAKFREIQARDNPDAAKPGAIPGAPRAADGKFAKTVPAPTPNGTPADEGVAPAPAVAVTETPEEVAAKAAAEAAKVAVPERLAKAPTSWKADTQAEYEKLSPALKAQVHQREEDFHKGLGQYKQLADIGKHFDNEFQPYAPMIRAAGLTPQTLVKNWLNTEYQLKTGSPEQKAALFAQYAKSYGVDIAAINTAYESGAPAAPPVDPQVEGLKTQLKTVTDQIEADKKAAQERENAVVVEEVQKFAQATGHEHYETVKLDMAALLSEGRAKDLQEAYDKATWAHPEVRVKLIAKQQEAERKLAADKAAAAKKASVTNVAPRGTLPKAPVQGTMDDTIRAKFRELTGASS